MLESRLRELVSSGNRSAATRLAQEVVKKGEVENVKAISDGVVKFEGTRFEATCTVNDDGSVSKTGEYTIQDGTWSFSFERAIPDQHQKTIHTSMKAGGVLSESGEDEANGDSSNSMDTASPESSVEESEETTDSPENDSNVSVSVSDESPKKSSWWVKIRQVFSKVR